VAGGTAILCTTGYALYEFLPAGRMLDVAEAILRVFHRLGDYKHKQRNRMKFLIRDIGWEAWRTAFDAALADVVAEGGKTLAFDPEAPPVEGPPEEERSASRRLSVRSAAFEAWARTNVRPQKQPHYAIATVTLEIGDITSSQLRTLATLADTYSDGTLRLTPEQNLLLRWVRHDRLPELHEQLVAAGLGVGGAGTAADVGSCPGADTCRIAVTQSRGLGKLLTEHLRARPEVVAAAGPLDLKISGCPNGCGQHHIAGIGFQGSVRRLGDRVVPQYFVMIGGGFEADHARFGRLAAKIPARRVPQAVERLIDLYVDKRNDGETATKFFQRVDLEVVKTNLADLEALRPEDALPADFVDLGEDHEFRVETMEGECMA
jgi:sulfite reductase (NADPH) hemoprotein beta-component